MLCEKCQREIADESTTCPLCGCELGKAVVTDTTTDSLQLEQEVIVLQKNSVEENPEPQMLEPQPMQNIQSEEQPQPMQDTQPEEQPKKKNKNLKIGIIIAAVMSVILIAIAIPVSLVAVKSYNYNEAVSFLEDKKYEDAKKIFIKMEDFKDSKKHVKACEQGIDYDNAVAFMAKEDYKAAEEILGALAKEKYEDSENLKILCENKQAYQAAQQLLDAGSYYDAYTAFLKMGDFEDAEEKASSCIQPTPATSELYRNEAFAATTCPVQITRTSASKLFPVVLKIKTEDDTLVSTLFLAKEEGYTVSLPPGSYKISMIVGLSQWFGAEQLFGALTFENQIDSGENNKLYVLQNNYEYTLSL